MLKKINNIAVKHNLYLFLSIIFAISIFLGSITPKVSLGSIKNSGFFAHFTYYFILSSIVLLYLLGRKFQKPFIKAILLTGSYGILIEFIQFSIFYRNFQILDIITNFSGAFLILILLLLNKKLKNFRIKKTSR